MEALSPRQKELYDFEISYIKKYGKRPSQETEGKALGMSISTVNFTRRCLKLKGWGTKNMQEISDEKWGELRKIHSEVFSPKQKEDKNVFLLEQNKELKEKIIILEKVIAKLVS